MTCGPGCREHHTYTPPCEFVLSNAARPSHDPVNHPSHYTSHPSGVECIEVTRHMTFNCGNVVKYLWRSGLKEGSPALEDLQKAAWYLNDEIERVRASVERTGS